ncbi:hypothetical protein WDZ92_43340 [Nostoc sp. NIES-2111]
MTKVKEGGGVMRKISAGKQAALERDKAEDARRQAVRAEIEALTPPSVPAFERMPPPGVDPDQFAELLLAILKERLPSTVLAFFYVRNAVVARLDEMRLRQLQDDHLRLKEMQASRWIAQSVTQAEALEAGWTVEKMTVDFNLPRKERSALLKRNRLSEQAARAKVFHDEYGRQSQIDIMLRARRREFTQALEDSVDIPSMVDSVVKTTWTGHMVIPPDDPVLGPDGKPDWNPQRPPRNWGRRAAVVLDVNQTGEEPPDKGMPPSNPCQDPEDLPPAVNRDG